MTKTVAQTNLTEAFWDSIDSLLGPISFGVDTDERVVGLTFTRLDPRAMRAPDRCRTVRRQLEEYFSGARTSFDLELAPVGTAFQQRVWKGLTEIPFGEAWGYGQLATHIGKPRAARAVGQANGRNPIPVIIPCHRVIAADRSIGGFSSGLPIKRQLLTLEHIEIAA